MTLLDKKSTIHASSLDKSSVIYKDGYIDGLSFFTFISIDTKDNSTEVSYSVSAFMHNDNVEKIWEDFTSYDEAVDKYNEIFKNFGTKPE